MFAHAVSRSASHAYRQIGAETGVSTASAHQLIVLLFDGFFDAVAQARGAMLAGRGIDKSQAIGRAARIVDEGLKAALDLRAGGELAANLSRLYGHVALRLTEANVNNDVEALEACARLLEPVRSAWLQIAPQAGRKTQ